MNIQHLCPTHWYAGMKWSRLQILVHAECIAQYQVEIWGDGVRLADIQRTENPNYLILYVETAGAPAQTFYIKLKEGDRVVDEIPYELRERNFKDIKTFDAHDVVYLLIPDRWCDGTAEDVNKKRSMYAGMHDNQWNPHFNHTTPKDGITGWNTRHGGDLAGMTRHLDYLKDLGVTAIWPTPLNENNNGIYTYHGYCFTDFYRIDPRLGTNDDYRNFVQEANRMGMKVIQDMVFNHCSDMCFLWTDKVSKSWFFTDERTIVSNFRTYAQSDDHLSQYDKALLTQGCFSGMMPSFNGTNEQVQDFLIQSSLWWIEFAGINGIT